MRHVITGFLLCAISTTLPAQWLKIKTPGIPRKADGKPDLTARSPRTPDGMPDLSGLWGTEDNTYILDIAADLKPSEVRPGPRKCTKDAWMRWTRTLQGPFASQEDPSKSWATSTASFSPRM